jgi:hypothetical protein
VCARARARVCARVRALSLCVCVCVHGCEADVFALFAWALVQLHVGLLYQVTQNRSSDGVYTRILDLSEQHPAVTFRRWRLTHGSSPL